MSTVSEPLMKLDFVQTLAFSGVLLFVGYGLCRFVRLSLPETPSALPTWQL
jgi:predicted secreted protein